VTPVKDEKDPGSSAAGDSASPGNVSETKQAKRKAPATPKGGKGRAKKQKQVSDDEDEDSADFQKPVKVAKPSRSSAKAKVDVTAKMTGKVKEEDAEHGARKDEENIDDGKDEMVGMKDRGDGETVHAEDEVCRSSCALENIY